MQKANIRYAYMLIFSELCFVCFVEEILRYLRETKTNQPSTKVGISCLIYSCE